MMEHLFVYGTLKPGHENAALLERIGGKWQAARVRGRLFPPAWTAAMGGYPGLIPDADAAFVPGYIFSSEQLASHWPALDDFEGDEYERILMEVELENGASCRANIYVFKEVPQLSRSSAGHKEVDAAPGMSSGLESAVQCLREGGVIAYPTEGVWGLGCDPARQEAVEKILQLKNRDVGKGLILVAASLDQLGALLSGLPAKQRRFLEENCPGPNTWLIPDPDQIIPAWIRGNFATVAVRVSAHPLVRDLCQAFGGMLVSTSANPAGKDPALSEAEVKAYFADMLDAVVPGELGGQQGPSRIIDLVSNQILRP